MTLTPQDVKAVQFGTVKMKSGYDMEDVDAFLDQVESELGRLLAENASLREQIRIFESAPATPAPEPVTAEVPVVAPTPPSSPSEQAVRILDLAQKTADETVAAANAEAEKILADARKRKSELDAQESAFRHQFKQLLEENLSKLNVANATVPTTNAATAWSGVPSAEVPGQ